MITTLTESQAGTGLAADKRIAAGWRAVYVRYFFVGMAVLFIAVTAGGFVPQLMEIHAGKISMHWFTHVHGAIMTGWLLLYLTQASLAAGGGLKYHRQLGVFSAGYAAVVWVTMVAVTIAALIRNNPPEADGEFNILALALVGAVMFGIFFAWGIRARRNAALHKRLLLLAMLPIMSAGVDRLFWLPGMQSAFFVRYLYLDALLLPLIAYDLITGHRIQRITWIGAVGLTISQMAAVGAAVSPVWHHFAYNAIAPFVERLPEVQLTEAQTAPVLGDYGNKEWHMTISRDGDKLYAQYQGQPKWEIGANSETTFFMKGFNCRMEFVKNAEGEVTKLINVQSGNTWEVERFPPPVAKK